MTDTDWQQLKNWLMRHRNQCGDGMSITYVLEKMESMEKQRIDNSLSDPLRASNGKRSRQCKKVRR